MAVAIAGSASIMRPPRAPPASAPALGRLVSRRVTALGNVATGQGADRVCAAKLSAGCADYTVQTVLL